MTVAYPEDEVTASPASLPFIRHSSVTVAIVKAVLFFIFCLIIVLGNMLVCAAVVKFRRLQRVTNYFIVSLAVADMLVGLVVMPFSAVHEVLGWWPFGMFCDVHASFDVTLCCASLYNLCIVSIDRYIAITSPLTYHSKMTPKVALGLITLAWLAAFSTFIPMVMGLSREQGFEYDYDNTTCKFVINKLFTFLITVPPFYIPSVFMVVAYARMFTIARQQARQITATQHNLRANGASICSMTLRERSRLASDTKALRVVITVVGVFIICWLPYFIVFPYDTFCRCVTDAVWGVTLWLGYLNSSFNPFIYAFNRDFR